MSDLPVFEIDRVFDAPRGLVWRAWTDPDLIVQWFGPKGCATRILAFDLRPGGICHFEIRLADAPPSYGKFVYQTISPPGQISWLHGFADLGGKAIHHPGNANWPLTLLTVVQFDDLGSTTRMRFSWTPVDAEPHEIEEFAGGKASMEQGWAGSFELLDNFLMQMKKTEAKGTVSE